MGEFISCVSWNGWLRSNIYFDDLVTKQDYILIEITLETEVN